MLTSLPKKKRQPMGDVYLLLIWCSVFDRAGGPQKKTPQSVSGCLSAIDSKTRSHYLDQHYYSVTDGQTLNETYVGPPKVRWRAQLSDCIFLGTDILHENIVHFVLAASLSRDPSSY
jgi:hypothetical protein